MFLIIGFPLLLILFTFLYCIPGMIRGIIGLFGSQEATMQQIVAWLRTSEWMYHEAVDAKVIMAEGRESIMIRYPNSKGDRYVFIPNFYDGWACHYLWRLPLLPKPRRVYAYLGDYKRDPKDVAGIGMGLLWFLRNAQTTAATQYIDQLQDCGGIMYNVFPLD